MFALSTAIYTHGPGLRHDLDFHWQMKFYLFCVQWFHVKSGCSFRWYDIGRIIDLHFLNFIFQSCKRNELFLNCSTHLYCLIVARCHNAMKTLVHNVGWKSKHKFNTQLYSDSSAMSGNCMWHLVQKVCMVFAV